MKTMNVAIDGPAGAGKSSIARELAAELGFIYVDTGALYRAIALYTQQHNLCNKQDIIRQLPKIDLKIKFIGGTQCILLNGEDVTDDIRTPEISMLASKVSAIPEVRDFLFDLQQKIAKEHHVIMDGRDIGTVVLPDADLKIFLTASPEERASRRYLELQEKPDAPTYEQILQDIKKRDYQDTHREIAPLRQAEDAVLIDTTNMGCPAGTDGGTSGFGIRRRSVCTTTSLHFFIGLPITSCGLHSFSIMTFNLRAEKMHRPKRNLLSLPRTTAAI